MRSYLRRKYLLCLLLQCIPLTSLPTSSTPLYLPFCFSTTLLAYKCDLTSAIALSHFLLPLAILFPFIPQLPALCSLTYAGGSHCHFHIYRQSLQNVFIDLIGLFVAVKLQRSQPLIVPMGRGNIHPWTWENMKFN